MFAMQVGWLSAAYRLAKKPGHWLPAVEHRQAVPPTKIGSFSYDFSRSNLQTVALDSDIVVDHVRFQVCSHPCTEEFAVCGAWPLCVGQSSWIIRHSISA